MIYLKGSEIHDLYKLKMMIIDRKERKYVKNILNDNIPGALKQKIDVEDI